MIGKSTVVGCAAWNLEPHTKTGHYFQPVPLQLFYHTWTDRSETGRELWWANPDSRSAHNCKDRRQCLAPRAFLPLWSTHIRPLQEDCSAVRGERAQARKVPW